MYGLLPDSGRNFMMNWVLVCTLAWLYVPKSKLKKTIWINEKKLTITVYPPVKKPVLKPKKKNDMD